MTTSPFTINGTEWRVNWQVSSYNNASRCYVSVYDAATNGPIVVVPHEQQSGEARFNTKGTFYLKIEVYGALQGWSVQVYQTA
jgi:carbohydrate-selective porin OprB